jgi:hypothetical protein
MNDRVRNMNCFKIKVELDDGIIDDGNSKWREV